MKIAGVRFRDNWRIYDFDATDIDVSVGDDVIVESDRGLGFARVVRVREGDRLPDLQQPQQEQQKPKDNGRKEEPPVEEEIEIDVETPGDIAAAAAAAEERQEQRPVDRPRLPKGHRKVARKATEEDIRKMETNRAREAEVFVICQDMIAERELPMKLLRAEYAFDASRVTFYFFSETRVDFRELVKDLAHRLRSRIEMRQVGVRDVARMIGGFGPCGRELCCTSFLRNFEPVSIRMAKKQEMVLNPAKISGICGRLLCCLAYEFPVYDEIKKDLAAMRESVVREKREAEEKRLADERRDAEERRAAEEKRRQEDDQKKQEQKQRDRQRQQEQKARKEEKRKEGQPEQKQRPPQDQRQRDSQQKQRPPQQAPQQGGPQPATQAVPQEQGEKAESRGKRKRRFWRKKKKKGAGGPQQPGGNGGTPAAGESREDG
jgi:cell fate regulator YaaT (PSP1 superfamily)